MLSWRRRRSASASSAVKVRRDVLSLGPPGPTSPAGGGSGFRAWITSRASIATSREPTTGPSTHACLSETTTRAGDDPRGVLHSDAQIAAPVVRASPASDIQNDHAARSLGLNRLAMSARSQRNPKAKSPPVQPLRAAEIRASAPSPGIELKAPRPSCRGSTRCRLRAASERQRLSREASGAELPGARFRHTGTGSLRACSARGRSCPWPR